MRKTVVKKNAIIGFGISITAMLIAAACGNIDPEIQNSVSENKPSISEYQSDISSSDALSKDISSKTETDPTSTLDDTSSEKELTKPNDIISESISEDSSQLHNTTSESEGNIQLDDILIIVRENGHGWNDSDTGKFITSDGRFFEFDATGLEPENKSARFIEYENLYPILLEIAKTENPLAYISESSLKQISENILNLQTDENEWTRESVGFDIGKVDYEIVRNIDGKPVFKSIYSKGDSICGYTNNEVVMKIVNEYNTINIENTVVESSTKTENTDFSKTEGLTEKDIADMDEVDKAISVLTESEDFKNGTLEEREKRSLEVINELTEKGLLKKDSVVKSGDLICFEYSCGAGGGVQLKEFDPLLN